MAEEQNSGVILIKFTGDPTQLEAAAAKAQAAVDTMATGSAQAGAKAAAGMGVASKAADTAAKSTDALGKQAATSSKQLLNMKMVISERLAPAIGMISPQAGAAVAGVGRLAAVAATFGLSLSSIAAIAPPVALALGAVALAYRQIEMESRLAAELNATEQKALESLIPSHRRLEDAKLALADATGILTDEEVRSLQVALLAQRAVLDFAKGQAAQREELRKTSDQVQTTRGVVNDLLTMGGAGVLTGVVDEFMGWGDTLENNEAQLGALDRALVRNAETEKEIRKLLEKSNRERREGTKATEEDADALRVWEAAAKSAIAAIKRQADANASLDALIRDMTASQLDDAERIEAAYQDRLRAIDAEQNKAADAAKRDEAYAAAKAEREVALADLAVEQQQRINDEEERLASERERRAREQAQYTQATYSAIDSLASTSAGALMAYANEVSDTNRDAALDAFNAYKAISIAQAAIATLGGVARALNDYPYPYSLIIGAAVGVEGAVQIGLIASEEPSFHAGGLIRDDAPGEVSTRQLVGESVLNRETTERLGENTINRLNRGEGGFGPTVVKLMFGHRALDVVMVDYARRGNPINAAAKTGVSQHRSGW